MNRSVGRITLAALCAAGLLAAACGGPEDEPEATGQAALTVPVKLAWAFSSRCPPVSGCTQTEEVKGVVLVKNLAYAKDVRYVYQHPYSGEWLTVAATYLAADPANPGYEAWSFKGPIASAFAFSYKVNNTTYWDNNGGRNYLPNTTGNDGFVNDRGIAGMIGVKVSTTPEIAGWVLVQNRAYTKVVKATYTDDLWKTTRTASATYEGTLKSGIELWRFTAPIATGAVLANVRLSSSVSFNGATALWDNDYTRNYRLDAAGVIIP